MLLKGDTALVSCDLKSVSPSVLQLWNDDPNGRKARSNLPFTKLYWHESLLGCLAADRQTTASRPGACCVSPVVGESRRCVTTFLHYRLCRVSCFWLSSYFIVAVCSSNNRYQLPAEVTHTDGKKTQKIDKCHPGTDWNPMPCWFLTNSFFCLVSTKQMCCFQLSYMVHFTPTFLPMSHLQTVVWHLGEQNESSCWIPV